MSVLAPVASVVIALSFLYLWVLLFAGLRTIKLAGTSISAMSTIGYEDPFVDEPGTFHSYFLIPCLNEERVIGATVRALAGSPHATPVVIDDASEDRTVEVARSHGGEHLVVLERRLPNARRGKGEALNDAVRLVRELVAERGQDVDRVLVVVMDADGRLSDGAMRAVLPLFDDQETGAVQLAVRIRNRDRFLTRFQDYNFWSLTSIAQYGRHQSATVSLGGNGQFSRLSALNEAGEKPWSESLTEDLDLAVTMALAGWKLATTPSASVEQQGVESIRTLFRQRRRWFQGHMMMARRLPSVWMEPNIPHLRAVELSTYILMPWVTILPWSVLFHVAVLGFPAYRDVIFGYVSGSLAFVVVLVLWYLLTFGPVLAGAWIYYKRDGHEQLWRALLLAHSFPLMNYIAFAAVWSALARILKGELGWQKTQRVAENLTPATAPGADDAVNAVSPAAQGGTTEAVAS
jgi:cellulose synthase/poly-beta-1,6-N-acetylglucosamine synthase-like glycosyltransferase